MKGFFQYLAPFAPDYSGAASVLYNAGGMLVVCDPGGCSGIICGYDEPRFYGGKTPLFSAALRELDTILGRDDHLIQKIVDAVLMEQPAFLALLGGPTVSVIGTDLDAIAAAVERQTNVPAFAVPTTGMADYDSGQALCYRRLLQKFLPDTPMTATPGGKTVLFGATPLSMVGKTRPETLCVLAEEAFGTPVVSIGGAETCALLQNPTDIGRILVTAPSGMAAAGQLAARLSLPCESWFPCVAEFTQMQTALRSLDIPRPRVLLVHQQIAANALRSLLLPDCGSVDVASFFQMDTALQTSGDRQLGGEDDLLALARAGYDCIVCDPFYRRALQGFCGVTLPLSQPAVSGEYYL